MITDIPNSVRSMRKKRRTRYAPKAPSFHLRRGRSSLALVAGGAGKVGDLAARALMPEKPWVGVPATHSASQTRVNALLLSRGVPLAGTNGKSSHYYRSFPRKRESSLPSQ